MCFSWGQDKHANLVFLYPIGSIYLLVLFTHKISTIHVGLDIHVTVPWILWHSRICFFQGASAWVGESRRLKCCPTFLVGRQWVPGWIVVWLLGLQNSLVHGWNTFSCTPQTWPRNKKRDHLGKFGNQQKNLAIILIFRKTFIRWL